MKLKSSNKSLFKPIRFYDELLNYGFLAEYIYGNFRHKLKSDKNFRREILEKLVKSKNEPQEMVDYILLEQLSHSLEYFNERVKHWMNKNQ